MAGISSPLSKSVSADQKNSTSKAPASGEMPIPRLCTSNVTDVVASPSNEFDEAENAMPSKSGPIPSAHQSRNSSHWVSLAKPKLVRYW